MRFYGIYYGVVESLGRALVSVGALPAKILFDYLWQTFGAPSACLAGAGFSALARVVFLAGALIRKALTIGFSSLRNDPPYSSTQ